MGSKGSLLLVFSFSVLSNFCSSEFVPVYVWGTQSAFDPVPALHKISQSSFKDDLENGWKNTPITVVFAEQSLSPEDFGKRDRSGNTAFPNLSKVRKTSKVTYLSYVQNPLKATKHATEDVAEISIERLNENFEIPEAKVVIIDLNDAKENERRFDMLKRHDEFIISVYNALLKKYGNVLALYTARHASWIGTGDVYVRKPRAISDPDSHNFLMDNSTILYYTSGPAAVTYKNKNDDKNTKANISLSYSVSTENNSSMTLTGNGSEGTDTLSLSFTFIRSVGGYWYLQEAIIDFKENKLNQSYSASVYAPLGFSYACGDQTFRNPTLSVTFPSFQVQPVFKKTVYTQQTKFDDPYNCVGFTTIPIWSGLFVTFILLLIMSFGLTMMMDIKTMDRFDDAKGKTITINTSE